jgi:hypothetical protein
MRYTDETHLFDNSFVVCLLIVIAMPNQFDMPG